MWQRQSSGVCWSPASQNVKDATYERSHTQRGAVRKQQVRVLAAAPVLLALPPASCQYARLAHLRVKNHGPV